MFLSVFLQSDLCDCMNLAVQERPKGRLCGAVHLWSVLVLLVALKVIGSFPDDSSLFPMHIIQPHSTLGALFDKNIFLVL